MTWAIANAVWENEFIAPCLCLPTNASFLLSLCISESHYAIWVFYKSSQNSNSALMLWWYARVWTRRSDGEVADVEEKLGRMESPLPPPLSPPPSAGAAAFNLSVHILLVFTFWMLTFWLFTQVFEIRSRAGRAGSSSVWQMVLFRCDYRCALWGRGGARHCDKCSCDLQHCKPTPTETYMYARPVHYFTTAGGQGRKDPAACRRYVERDADFQECCN